MLGTILFYRTTTSGRRAVMRARLLVLGAVAASLAACDRSTPVSPDAATTEVIDLIPDYAVSPATSIDAAGIGASDLPDAIKLTAEQKAAIAALHDAFMKANAADIAALQAIEDQAKAAIKAGKSRDEVRAILAKAEPIRERLEAAFKKLQADIWAIYTPEQRAWIEAHRLKSCRPGDLKLTDAQVHKIRELEQQFLVAVKPDLDLIKSIVEEARQAKEAGKSRAEVAAILAKAAEPQKRVAEAERKLKAAILEILTPEQRQRWLCRHA
jgi:Spy/CpxP family protein refolding chaperone